MYCIILRQPWFLMKVEIHSDGPIDRVLDRSDKIGPVKISLITTGQWRATVEARGSEGRNKKKEEMISVFLRLIP